MFPIKYKGATGSQGQLEVHCFLNLLLDRLTVMSLELIFFCKRIFKNIIIEVILDGHIIFHRRRDALFFFLGISALITKKNLNIISLVTHYAKITQPKFNY